MVVDEVDEREKSRERNGQKEVNERQHGRKTGVYKERWPGRNPIVRLAEGYLNMKKSNNQIYVICIGTF